MAIEKSGEPARFAAFEQAGWDANIAGYDRAFGALARRSVPAVLDAAGVARGARVLDVCCGAGLLAAGALERGAEAVGLDFSAPAVALARRQVPGASFRQGDAQALPFPAGSFDAVVCGYGLMHLPEPAAALNEMLRVLRAGGRVAVSVWDSSGVGFALIYEAARACGAADAALPRGPDAFQFGAPARMRAALAESGFADAAAQRFDQDWRVADLAGYLDAIRTGTVRSGAVLAAQSGAAAAAMRAHIAGRLARFRAPAGGFAVPMPAVIGSGARPG
jgi:ubiquinone/menaquinone biosynthesis C-methylase UbiE